MSTEHSMEVYRTLAGEYASGKSFRQVEKEQGYSITSIKRGCVLFGVPRRKPGRPATHGDDVLAEIRKLRLDGVSQREIKRRLGASQKVVERAIIQGVLADRDAGMRPAEIAEKNALDEEKVRRFIERAGKPGLVLVSSKGIRSDEDKARADAELAAAMERDRAWHGDLDRRRALLRAA